MAIKERFPLEYVVDLKKQSNENIDNYDILTVSLDRKNYSQEEIVNFIDNSMDEILTSKDDSYNSLSKEEVHKVDINKHKFIVKIPVNYKNSIKNIRNSSVNSLKAENSKENDEENDRINNDQITENSNVIDSMASIYTSKCYSGSSGYGLNLL